MCDEVCRVHILVLEQKKLMSRSEHERLKLSVWLKQLLSCTSTTSSFRQPSCACKALTKSQSFDKLGLRLSDVQSVIECARSWHFAVSKLFSAAYGHELFDVLRSVLEQLVRRVKDEEIRIATVEVVERFDAAQCELHGADLTVDRF